MAGTPYGGAYGLRLPQFGPSEPLLPAPDHWPSWSLMWGDNPPDGPWQWSDARAVLPLQPRGRAVVDRPAATTVLHNAARHDAALLHPYLATTALAVAAWSRRVGLHAGVVGRAGRAWGLLGDRGAGKSSLLMWWLHNAGDVLADDLLITDGTVVVSGPRFLDLRASAAQHYSAGSDVGVLGSRRRWRVPTGTAEPELPLAGLVELRWGAAFDLSPIPVTERLNLAYHYRGLNFPVDDRLGVLRTLALPAFTFTRPKSWATVDDDLHRLVERLDWLG